MSKKDRIEVRVIEETLAQWTLLADAEGISLSEWLRRAADHRASQETGKPPRILPAREVPPVTKPEPKRPNGLRRLQIRTVSGAFKMVDASTLCPRCLRIGALSCAECRARHP